MELESPQVAPDLRKISRLIANVERVIKGKSEVVQFATAAMLAKGHVLFEDVPGVGKTTLAQALSRSLSLTFQRIQFTSDLLPADIVGVTIFNQDRQEFEFVPGPVFTNILLADEINRATPKSQSALLEAMNEGVVTIERRSLPLPDPFLVLATQNPVEHIGTYPLPESQLDRFLMRLTIGYPNFTDEKKLLRSGGAHDALERLEPVLSLSEFQELQKAVLSVHADETIVDYVMSIVVAIRTHPEIAIGVSTRGALTYFKAAQALAMVEGRDFVVPDDVKRLAVPVLSHRISLKDRRAGASFTSAIRFVETLIAQLPVPR